MDKPFDRDQLEKRVDWLDTERRNDKTVIAALQGKIETLETENAALRNRLTEMDSEITRLNTLMARLEQFEQEITGMRSELGRQVTDVKGSIQENQIQVNRGQQKISDLNEDLTSLRKRIKDIEELDLPKALGERADENIRLARLNEELKAQVSEIAHFDDDYKRSLRMLEENRRQDTKRITDMQGEIASLRKRYDETRAKQDLVSDNMRKLEVRIKDLLDAESERRESQTAFVEKLNMGQVERDRAFKQWTERFEQMEKLTTGLEEEISGLENTHRSVKQSQTALDEMTQRFDRRVNEITEVQRLTEDRFRQEWTTFKSDDQKRWSNYILSQEEQHREMNKAIESLVAQISIIEDQLGAVKDNLQQLGQEDIKRLQSILATLRDSIDHYNNIFKE